MVSKLQELKDNHTWEIMSLPEHHHVIGSKWVYKVKLKLDGTVERYNARLVAEGYSQIEEFNYHDTFSLVVKYTTVKLFFVVAQFMAGNVAI